MTLGMSLVLAMTSAPPVWATTSGVVTTNTNGGEASASEISSPTGGIDVETASDYTDANRQISESEIKAINNYSFTVSVPKTIKLSNTGQTGQVAFSGSKPIVQIKDCDLAPLQILQVYVVDKNNAVEGNVVLNDKGGSGEAIRRFNVTLGNTSDTSWAVNTVDTNKGLHIINSTKASNAVDPLAEDVSATSQEVKINQLDPIFAGKWSGNITFGINVNKVDGHSASGD